MASPSPSGIDTDARAANRARFELELEFVQALANPFYLHSLAQQNILEQPAFVNYLKYLLYFKEKDYARFIHYPHALHHLELLQHPQFRARLKNDEFFREYLHQKQFDHWRTWRDAPRVQPIKPQTTGQAENKPDANIIVRDDLLSYGVPGSAPIHDQPLLNDAHASEGIHFAIVKERQRLWWREALINTLFIGSWFSFATILSVYNKWMFSPDRYGFPSPLFVTTMHMFIQFLLAAFARFVFPSYFRPQVDPSPADYGKHAVPTAIATSLDIGLSNVSLTTITLSFYTMCKSSSLIFVLLFAFLFRLEIFSWRLVAVICLIFSGIILMVATETHFVLNGFILVISASALGGLRWSLTQLLLRSKKMGFDSPAATIFWLAPIMGFTLGIISMLVEHWGDLFKSKFFSGLGSTLETSIYLTAPGIVAFCMVISEFYIIQRTGVVPMSIAGIAKEVTTISISAWFFGDKLTPLNITGVGITVCGIALFTYHKYRKSVYSSMKLDVHGNPVIIDADTRSDTLNERDYQTELDERVRFITDQDDDHSDYQRLESQADKSVLFSAGRDHDT
ncbi:hypothetical protein APHAL10511_000147 [Amanita phalloides]|nr:hypothetical protein APHAL10511_000147 [Amanita phalloides]